MIYFLNRFANLSWKIDLCQMWLISLLFLPLSFALLTIPYGVQHDSVTEDEIKSQCTICYDAPYEQQTFSKDIILCAGPVLFVGVRKGSSWWFWVKKTMHLGAFALASEVHQTTALNTPHLSNGVYWYFTPGKSFGFLSDTDLHQEPTGDTGTTNIEARLSWNLDNGYGGYRAGADTEFNYNLYKFIYNCPNTFEG